MQHDFSIVFDTDNPLWNRVLEIFEKNEKYEKKVVSNRNLHHKFPRSFSKKMGEPVDNDKDNLISLSLAEHFLVHYYYYLLARKGYRQSMATAFTFMAKKGLKYMTPETAEAMAKDYEEARDIANQHIAESLKGRTISDETRRKMSERMKGNQYMKDKHHSDDTCRKMSESKKGKSPWCEGKTLSEEHRSNISKSMKGKNLGKTFTAEHRKKLSESHKAENLSNDVRKKMSESKKGKHWKIVDGKRVWY